MSQQIDTQKFGAAGHFKIGLFSPNCSGGLAITNVSERWEASWENNLALARMSDDAGIDFILPIARWIGYGGATGFQNTTLETITWATGLLAATSRIRIFATAHVAFMHPLVAAKQFATMSHIGAGRFGLNVVCGWNKPEYETFGLAFADAHADRYAYGKEWLDIVRRVWSSTEPFDWDGTHFHLKGAYGSPLPYNGRPLIFNAGFSADGRAFAERNADYLLTTLVDIDKGSEDVASIKANAADQHGRDVDVIATTHVVCRPTTSEAQAYYEYYSNEQADWPAVDRLMELQALHAKSFPPKRSSCFGSGSPPASGRTPSSAIPITSQANWPASARPASPARRSRSSIISTNCRTSAMKSCRGSKPRACAFRRGQRSWLRRLGRNCRLECHSPPLGRDLN